ncbi:hypothetical protein Tco_0019448 [Tanacetum coccineum]
MVENASGASSMNVPSAGKATASPAEGEKNTKDADTNIKDDLVDLLGKNVVTQYYTKKLLFDKYCDKMLKRKKSPKITKCEVKKGSIIMKIYREDGNYGVLVNINKRRAFWSLMKPINFSKLNLRSRSYYTALHSRQSNAFTDQLRGRKKKHQKMLTQTLKDELVDLLGKNVVTQYYIKKLLFDKYCDKMLKRKKSPKITKCEVKKGSITMKIYREDGRHYGELNEDIMKIYSEDQYYAVSIKEDTAMDYPNITMVEYIRLEEEKSRKRGKVFNWETAKYGKIWYDEDIHNLRSVKTKFPTIAFNGEVSSETLSYEPTVSSLNDEIDFRVSFDDSDDEDYIVFFDKNSFSYKKNSTTDLKTDSENNNEKLIPSLLSLEPAVIYLDDLDFFKDFENEFPAIVYNDAQM